MKKIILVLLTLNITSAFAISTLSGATRNVVCDQGSLKYEESQYVNIDEGFGTPTAARDKIHCADDIPQTHEGICASGELIYNWDDNLYECHDNTLPPLDQFFAYTCLAGFQVQNGGQYLPSETCFSPVTWFFASLSY